MSTLRADAVEVARTLPLTPGDSVRSIARALQEPLLRGVGRTATERLERVDREFTARVSGWEMRSEERPARAPRLVTPWPDFVGLLAVGWAMGSAAGAGRLTGGTPMNSLPVVAPTVIISLAIALLVFLAGAIFARRERDALLAQYVEAAAVSRSGFILASAIFALVALIAMIVRLLTDDVFPAAVLATVMTAVTTVATIVLGVAAQRLAKAGASGGKLIPRIRGSAQGRARNEAISASEDARDQTADALASAAPSTRDEIADAYAAAVAEVAARRVLPPSTVKRLSPADWIAARYAVEV